MLPTARTEAGSRLVGQLRGQLRHLTSVDSLRKTVLRSTVGLRGGQERR